MCYAKTTKKSERERHNIKRILWFVLFSNDMKLNACMRFSLKMWLKHVVMLVGEFSHFFVCVSLFRMSLVM